MRIKDIDRRVIFLLLILGILLPVIFPLTLPGLKVTQSIKEVFDFIEALDQRSPILISFDFDPGSKPELEPMAISLLKHAFQRDLRVIAVTLWVTGIDLTAKILGSVADELGKEYGKDYVFLGWRPGEYAPIVSMGGKGFKETFEKDFYRYDLEKLEVMQGVGFLKDIRYAISISAGYPGIEEWIRFGSDVYGFPLGGGCTAVQEPRMRAYLQSGQLTGLIGAMKGAAVYEKLMQEYGIAARGMDAISLGHFLIILFILVGNILYWRTRAKGRAR
jgi:hypothetical protein